MQRDDGQFHNFLSKKGKFLDDVGSQDSFARTFWALRFFKNYYCRDLPNKKKVQKIFEKSQKYLLKLNYLRSKAFILLGLGYGVNESEIKLILKLGQDLILNFKKNSSPNWCWFENTLTYSNAILPLGLFSTYQITKNKKFLVIALKSLDFLIKICQEKGIPVPIGNAGWYKKDGKKALFDQQCIDVADMVLALVAAFRITCKQKYLGLARKWFLWFYGNNISQVQMYDEKTGAAFDGLKPWGKINKDQGAESTLAYLMSYLALAEIEKERNATTNFFTN